MASPPPREKLLTLGDATLHTDDLALLVPPAWFNDALISFWTEHLRLHVLRGVDNVAVIPPNVSFFLALCNDDKDATELLRNLHLADRELILLTVNDSLDVDFSGSQGPSGSHWSLLAFERASSTFYYLDSLRSQSNEPSGRALVGKLKRLLKVPKARFVTLAVPLQENSYDCGAYLCMFAEEVIINFRDGNRLADLYKARDRFTPADVEAKRQEIGKLACRLLDEQQQKQQREKGTKASAHA